MQNNYFEKAPTRVNANLPIHDKICSAKFNRAVKKASFTV